MTRIAIEQETLELTLAELQECKSVDDNNRGRHQAIAAIKQALAAPVQPVACLIGAKGSAFDLPETKRAYTYKEQPGNLVAVKLGVACLTATKKTAGDGIDRGLSLLQELQKEGFGVFDLGAEYTVAQPAAPNFHAFTAWANGEGYDTAHAHDGEKWVCLNPMTADLWRAWQASRGITPATPPNPAA
jgi:hypothetical protein